METTSAPTAAVPTSPITLTSEAATRLRDEMARRGGSAKALRVMVFPGGCAGLQYAMSFTDKSPEEFETTFESEGVTLYVDSRYVELLQGARVQWIDSLIGGGFKFDNPNAQHACGCGKSFS